MSENTTGIETLDGLDTSILNRKGWYLVTHFRARDDSHSSAAYDNAIERAQKHNRKTGIRTLSKNGFTYYEIWDYWK